jgi:lysozyme family protein
MAGIKFSKALKDEYQNLFDTCEIRADKIDLVENILSKIAQNRNRYASVGDELEIPWQIIGVIHNMESDMNFSTHLHNGDPLTERTTHVPAGRPKIGTPPFTWEESATDALKLQKFDQWGDWSVPGALYELEGYNGWGYRLKHPHVLSPYLWSYSNHYESGKYVADGRWSETAVSRQCGAAVLLRRMAEKEMIDLPVEGVPLPLRYSSDGIIPGGEQLQRFLNQFPGIYLKVDGWPGRKTSDAFRKVFGYYLVGDPRA